MGYARAFCHTAAAAAAVPATTSLLLSLTPHSSHTLRNAVRFLFPGKGTRWVRRRAAGQVASEGNRRIICHISQPRWSLLPLFPPQHHPFIQSQISRLPGAHTDLGSRGGRGRAVPRPGGHGPTPSSHITRLARCLASQKPRAREGTSRSTRSHTRKRTDGPSHWPSPRSHVDAPPPRPAQTHSSPGSTWRGWHDSGNAA